MLAETDSEELSEWYAYDQRWPIGDSWQQTARICRVIMASSGNYKRVPDEEKFIPVAVRRPQDKSEMEKELEKFAKVMGARGTANDG